MYVLIPICNAVYSIPSFHCNEQEKMVVGVFFSTQSKDKAICKFCSLGITCSIDYTYKGTASNLINH